MNGFSCNKKRISTLILGLIFFLPSTEAQQLADVQQLWQQKELAAAREQIELYTTAQPGDMEGWLLKAEIFTAISNDATLQNSVADGRMEAIQSLQKAAKLDLERLTNKLKKDSFTLPFQLYNGYSNDGIAAFNTAVEMNDKAVFVEALNLFKKGSLIGTIIYTNKWGLQAIDTNNLYYSAKAAVNAGKTEEAVAFSRKIVDAHITQTLTNKGFESLYQWLVYHYRTQNNEVLMDRYAALANAAYPGSAYYLLNYIDWLREHKSFDQLYRSYQELFKRGFNKVEYRYACLLDIYNHLYDGSEESEPGIKYRNMFSAEEPTSTMNFRELLERDLTIYIRQNPADVNGKLLFGKFYINQAADVRKEMTLRSTTDATVMSGYKKRISANLVLSNKYLREIADKFPQTDRAVYNETLQLLVSNFISLKQPALAKKYAAKIK